MKRRILRWAPGMVCALAFIGAAGLARAEEAKKPDAPELANYEHTGKRQSCIYVHQIDSTEILNNHQILFHMHGHQTYLAEVESCPQLSRGIALRYEVTNDQLCTSTIIHLFDAGEPAPERGACGVTDFELLNKKPK